MIYGISIITTTGFPYYDKDYAIEPRSVKLKILFFDFTGRTFQSGHDIEPELVAGLASALFNFSSGQNRPINELIYTRPEFQVEDLLDSHESTMVAGTLITVRCDIHCMKSAVKQKLDYIYQKFIKNLEPLSEKTRLAPSEEKAIQDVLLNAASKQLVRSHSKELDNYLKNFIKEYQGYGVKAVAITSNDLTILKASNISDDDLSQILRVVEVPEVEPLLWKFRQAWTKDNQQVSLVFINSAYIASYDTLNEPLYYIIVCEAYSTIGELPRKLYLELNSILG